MSTTTRRSIVRGSLWAAPAVAVASAAPAMAASGSFTPQLTYQFSVVANTQDPNKPGTSYCTAPQLILTNTSPDSESVTILKIAAWNDALKEYTYGPVTVGSTLPATQTTVYGGDVGNTPLYYGEPYYGLVKWQDAGGAVHTLVTCPIQSQDACGQAGETVSGTDMSACSLPAGVSLPAGW